MRALASSFVLIVVTAAIAAAVAAIMHCMVPALGTAPPPYNDPNKSITNALGGLGRTQGWTATVTTGAAFDLFADGKIPTDIRAEVESPQTTSFMRFVTVTRVPTSGASSVSAACARLGPTTNPPEEPLACPEVDDSDASTGGCFLYADDQFCQFTLRPITSCDNYDQCHIPVWAVDSTGSQQLHVTIAW